jgi:hypothetical protein
MKMAASLNAIMRGILSVFDRRMAIGCSRGAPSSAACERIQSACP